MLTFKIVIIGDTAVGKTSLISHFINGKFIPNISSTIGASFSSRDLIIGNDKIRLNLWDTAGQEKFRSMVSMYYRDTDFCIIVFDISNYCVDNIRYWITEYIEKTSKSNPNFVLVGNKYDKLIHKFSINSDLKKLKAEYSVELFKTSALDGSNIDELFQYIGKILLKIPSTPQLNTNINDKISIEQSDIQYNHNPCCF